MKELLNLKAPLNLGHKPIIAVNNYNEIDAKITGRTTDAQALSIGQAQYHDNQISVKIWRHGDARWSPQSEEMPIHRAIDLSILAIAVMLSDENTEFPLTSLGEEIIVQDKVFKIKEYYEKNREFLHPKLRELKKILEKFVD